MRLPFLDSIRLRLNKELECHVANPRKIRAYIENSLEDKSTVSREDDRLKHSIDATAAELAEGLLPSIVFFEDTFAAQIEKIFVGGIAPISEVGPLLYQQTGAQVQELAPQISSDQDISGEHLEPAAMAGIVGALLG